jgi:hypothetical protein
VFRFRIRQIAIQQRIFPLERLLGRIVSFNRHAAAGGLDVPAAADVPEISCCLWQYNTSAASTVTGVRRPPVLFPDSSGDELGEQLPKPMTTFLSERRSLPVCQRRSPQMLLRRWFMSFW